LVCAIVLGKRRGFPSGSMVPHNLPFAVTGAALLWVGWFGFNAGSALAADGIAANAFVTTNTAASAAALSWMFCEWKHSGKPTMLGAATGAVAGLVGITPGAGFVGPLSAIIIGGVAGIVCYLAVVAKNRFGYDDSLDVVGVHGVGGSWGAIATGLFANKAINASGANGLFFGNAAQLWPQIVAVAGTIVYAGVITWIILKILDVTIGLRVSDEDEQMGLDLSQHNESGYVM
ncbi:MAG: ammonia channel protein, partial [bacterium]|nr:ammonia channel protein [bacterium]